MPDGNPRRRTDGGQEELPDDVVADLLAVDRCRLMLDCLSEREEPMAIDDLASAVAARELGTRPDRVDEETVERVRDDLFQRHLPKLTPTGIVAYDSLLGTVALDTADERVLSALGDDSP
ncbi:MAG: hypothetical protein ABEJ40_05820 [Haloarculaceae archaeon]